MTAVDDEEILAGIQHFGGATNLIDFTVDYLIALFFASVKGEETAGRIVLHWPDPASIVRPKQASNRIVAQKSLFIRPRRGFILPDAREETVVTPADLKAGVLRFLERFHGISERTVFNDIHGFIRHRNPVRSGYAREFRESLAIAQGHEPGGFRRQLQVVSGIEIEQWTGIGIQCERKRHACHQRQSQAAGA